MYVHCCAVHAYVDQVKVLFLMVVRNSFLQRRDCCRQNFSPDQRLGTRLTQLRKSDKLHLTRRDIIIIFHPNMVCYSNRSIPGHSIMPVQQAYHWNIHVYPPNRSISAQKASKTFPQGNYICTYTYIHTCLHK